MTEIIPVLQLSPLETLVVLSAASLVLARWLPSRARRPVVAAAAAAVVLSATALGVAGLRWQMLPVLAAVAVVLPFAVAPLLPRRSGRPARRARWWLALPGSAACLGLVAAGPAAAWALPAPVFPEPSGGYPVGTTVMEWTDRDRPETATPAPEDRRTVVAQLWYPAQQHLADAPRARYLGRTEQEARIVADAIASYLGVPEYLQFLLDGVPRARTNAVFDAPAAGAGERFPVVLFSPGAGGVRTQNTAWAEELASHGYVVVALDHPYDAAAVVLADGRTIHTRVAATGDPDQDRELAAEWTATRAADLGFARTQIDRLDRGAIPGPLTGRLDTGRVAVTGHSLGGAAALQAADQDGRFAAVIDLDGYPHGPTPRSLDQPTLAVTQAIGPHTDPDYIPRLTEVLERSTAPGYRLTVTGAAHLSFTDAPLFVPPAPALVGSLGRTGGLDVTTATTLAFLDATLRGHAGDLPDDLSSYGDLSLNRPASRR